MLCPSCGSPMEDDAKFCTSCGTPVAQSVEPVAEPEPVVEPVVEAAPVEEPVVAEPVVEAAPVEEPVVAEPRPVQQEQPVRPVPPAADQSGIASGTGSSKKKTNFLTIPILAVIAIAVVVVIGVKLLGGMGGDTSKYVAYIKNNTLYFVADMDKDKEPVAVTKMRSDTDYYSPVLFSEDGKYLYFIDNMNEYDEGKLCRIQISKLKSERSENEEQVEKIDSSVYAYSVNLVKDGVVYCTSNNRLYYFDGKEETVLAKKVSDWNVDAEDMTVIYSREEGDGTYQLCQTKISAKAGEEQVLDEEIDLIYTMYDSNCILYFKDQQEHLDTDYWYQPGDLYCYCKGEEPALIAEDVSTILGVDVASRTVYYGIEEGTEVALYEFVDDTLATSDKQMEKPDPKEFLTPTTLEQVLSPGDYELYTVTIPDGLETFYEYLYMDDDMEMYTYTRFIDSDYVKFYYDETSTQWYQFNNELYQEAKEAYYSIEDRQELREELKEETILQSSGDIYRYVFGSEPELVCEDVNTESTQAIADMGIVIYQKAGIPDSKIDIQSITYTYEVEELLDEYEDSKRFYRVGTGEEQELELELMSYIYGDSEGSRVILETEDNELYYAVISGDTIGEPELIADEATGSYWQDGVFYFYEGIDAKTCTFCKYEDGNTVEIADDVIYSGIQVCSKDLQVALADWTGDHGKLTLYDGAGESTKVATNVTSYQLIEKNRILYIRKGDLYVHNGSKEDREIDTNVKVYYVPEVRAQSNY